MSTTDNYVTFSVLSTMLEINPTVDTFTVLDDASRLVSTAKRLALDAAHDIGGASKIEERDLTARLNAITHLLDIANGMIAAGQASQS